MCSTCYLTWLDAHVGQFLSYIASSCKRTVAHACTRPEQHAIEGIQLTGRTSQVCLRQLQCNMMMGQEHTAELNEVCGSHEWLLNLRRAYIPTEQRAG